MQKGGYSLRKEESKKRINILHHELVPRHEILSKKEAEEVLATYHIQPHQLPYIRESDPAVVMIGGKAGDIVKITRRSPTAGEVVTYRYVIKD
jgi:DNA-directed RNA polymerase subunit H